MDNRFEALVRELAVSDPHLPDPDDGELVCAHCGMHQGVGHDERCLWARACQLVAMN